MSSKSQYKRRRKLPSQKKEKARKKKLLEKNQQPRKAERERPKTSTCVITNGPLPTDNQNIFPRSMEVAKATVYNKPPRSSLTTTHKKAKRNLQVPWCRLQSEPPSKSSFRKYSRAMLKVMRGNVLTPR